MEIIRATEDHVSDIGKLWLEFMRFSQYIDPIFKPQDSTIPLFINEYLRPAIEAENSLVLVAIDEGKVIGYSYSLISDPSNLVKRGKYGNIHDLFITASHRRKGIGEMMFVEIMKWFQSNNIDRVELDVITQNQIASSFWEKHGFTNFKSTLYRNI